MLLFQEQNQPSGHPGLAVGSDHPQHTQTVLLLQAAPQVQHLPAGKWSFRHILRHGEFDKQLVKS